MNIIHIGQCERLRPDFSEANRAVKPEEELLCDYT